MHKGRHYGGDSIEADEIEDSTLTWYSAKDLQQSSSLVVAILAGLAVIVVCAHSALMPTSMVLLYPFLPAEL